MDTNNVTADTCSLESSSQRENSNAIFASEKLENSCNIVDAFKNMTIHDDLYELNTETASDAQVKFSINPDKSAYTSDGITHQKLLSSRTIGIFNEYIYVLPPPTYPQIGANNQLALLASTGSVQAPQALQLPVSQEIVADAASNRTVPNRTPQQVSRTGVDGTTPYISEICGNSASPPSSGLWNSGIVNKRQSTSLNFCKSNELDAAADGKFTNNPIAPPVINQVFSDKLSNSSRRDIYTRCRMHLTIDPINPVA